MFLGAKEENSRGSRNGTERNEEKLPRDLRWKRDQLFLELAADRHLLLLPLLLLMVSL